MTVLDRVGARFRRATDEHPWVVTAWPFFVFVVSPFAVYPWCFIRNGLLDGGDDVLSNLPMLLHSARALLRLEVFWTPSLWLGTPLVEEPEFATFYLPRLVLLVLPPVAAFAIYVLSHYVLAQVALYAYARSLDVSRVGAVFGALVYAFSGFMLGHRGHTMYLVAGAWAPLFLTFLRRLELGRHRLDLFGATVSFAALPLSGALQLTAYLVLAASLVQATRAALLRSVRPLIALVYALLPGSLVGALQVLPSIGLSTQLVDLPGDRFAFSTLLSYDPRQLPLLVTPLDPLSSAELYSRVGGVALVFAVAAIARRRSPFVAAWLVVLASSLVLMLGHHVPVLPRLLQSLPLVDVFRGPVRHNFELGLAVAVLAAFGFDAVFEEGRPPRRTWVWLSSAVAACALARVLGAVATQGAFSLPDARALARAADPPSLWVGAALLAFGLAAVGLSAGRARYAVLALVVIAPLVDGRYSVHRFDRVWPDWAEQMSIADVRAGGTDFARVLSPPLSIAGPDALAANSPLAHPGLAHMLGYASRVDRDLATVLDLDLHGHPKEPVDLAWSRLPDFFGVSYVILPEAVCAPLDFGVATPAFDGACGDSLGGVDLPLDARELRCSEPLTEGRMRLRVNVRRPREIVPTALRVEFVGRGPDASVDTVQLHQRQPGWWLSKHALPPHGWMTASPTTLHPLELESLQLDAETLQPIADLAARSDRQLFGATEERGSVVLTAEGSVAHADKWFAWPEWIRARARRHFKTAMDLEVVSRADEPPSDPLVVDLYGGADFDPVSAQSSVEPRSIRPYFSVHDAPIEAPDPPPRVALRALLEGHGSVEVKRARLLAEHHRPLVTLEGRRDAVGTDFDVESNISVGPQGIVRVEYHLPTRPVRVEVDVGAKDEGERKLAFGVRADPGTPAALEWQHAVELAPGESGRFSLTAAVPPTAHDLQPFAAVLKGGAVDVRELSVHDACSRKSLVPLRTLESGWVVYGNADALPRVFTVSDVRVVRSLDETRRVLRDDPGFDPKKTALVFDGEKIPKNMVVGSVERRAFGAQTAEFEVRSNGGPTLLVVNDRYHERWRATVDGADVPIHRANGLVRAIVVPAGDHVVRMHYAPPWTVSAGAAGGLLGFVLAFVLRRRSPSEAPS